MSNMHQSNFKNRMLVTALTIAGCGILAPQSAFAVEGGTSAYLMGSRDSFAGIVPGPGSYFGMDFIGFSGSIEGVSFSGLPIRAKTNIDVSLIKLSFTRVFNASLWGGTPAINLNVPILDVSANYTAITPPIAGAHIVDGTSGVGDITITPMVGWHRGNLHYSAALSVFVPTGSYSTATVSVSPVGVDSLNNGRDVWSFQPVLSATHMNTDTGLEFSGAASMLFTQYHSATEYQTAPAVTFEAAVLQHLKSGWAFGATGYGYQQIGDDSGDGADAIKGFLQTDSLQASALGLGPIVTYSGKMFGQTVSFKLKYIKEFGVKNRFESDMVWFNASISF